MGSAFAPLNGSGPQRIWLTCYWVSNSTATNKSTWYWELRYYGEGYGSWGSGTNTWGLSGFAGAGPNNWSIPSSAAFDTYTVLGSGYFTKPHNAAGYLIDGSNLTGSIATNHSAIGDGSVTVDPGSAPRIPKVPSAPPAPVFVDSDPDAIRFTISGVSDNGGATVTSYRMRVVSNDGSTLIGEWDSGATQQTTAGKVVLAPGTKYRILYAAKNSVGFGSYSAYTTMETEAGIFVSDGVRWVGAGPKVSDGATYQSLIPKISNGTAWVNPLEVPTPPEINDVDFDSATAARVFIYTPEGALLPNLIVERATNEAFTTGVASVTVARTAVDQEVPVTGLPPATELWWRARWDVSASTTKAAMWSEVLRTSA